MMKHMKTYEGSISWFDMGEANIEAHKDGIPRPTQQ
jgi:hypothetical protein